MVRFLLLSFFAFQFSFTIAQAFIEKEQKDLILPEQEALLDFDIAPQSNQVVLLTQSEFGKQTVRIWDINPSFQSQVLTQWEIPGSFATTAVIWHPQKKDLFFLGTEAGKFKMIRSPLSSWKPVLLYESKEALRRMVVSPQFMKNQEYRLFFGMKNPDAHYSIHSIDERGKQEMIVMDSTPPKGAVAKNATSPTLIATSALPVVFDPKGKFLVWEDEDHCFQKALYENGRWIKIAKFLDSKSLCQGGLAISPDGSKILHWKSTAQGVMIRNRLGKPSHRIAENLLFESPPAFLKEGIFGAVKEGNRLKLVFLP
jgi:hypothetical protein